MAFLYFDYDHIQLNRPTKLIESVECVYASNAPGDHSFYSNFQDGNFNERIKTHQQFFCLSSFISFHIKIRF